MNFRVFVLKIHLYLRDMRKYVIFATINMLGGKRLFRLEVSKDMVCPDTDTGNIEKVGHLVFLIS